MTCEQAFSAITAISSLALAIVAVIGVTRITRKALFKNETLFGREAKDRFDHLKNSSPNGLVFEPALYMGGNKQTPQFEIEKLNFDPQTMPPAWKGYTKSVRYYEKEGSEKIMEHCWLLK